jgi:hypothetical protein
MSPVDGPRLCPSRVVWCACSPPPDPLLAWLHGRDVVACMLMATTHTRTHAEAKALHAMRQVWGLRILSRRLATKAEECVALRCVALRCVALRCVALRCVALRCVYCVLESDTDS